MILRRWGPALVAVVATVLVAVPGTPADAGAVFQTCDVFLFEPDGSVATTPTLTGLRFFTVASAVAPAEVREGERFTITVPSESVTLTSSGGGFELGPQRDFLRVFEVTGATVVPGSVEQVPSTGATASTTATTVALGVTTEVASGGVLRYPAATFDVIAASAGTDVTVSLVRAESTVDVILPDDSVVPVRAVCPSDPNLLSRTTVLAARPTSKEECKRGGWRRFVDDRGVPFRTQGRCVSSVVSQQ